MVNVNPAGGSTNARKNTSGPSSSVPPLIGSDPGALAQRKPIVAPEEFATSPPSTPSLGRSREVSVGTPPVPASPRRCSRR
jgi:hypothetical protein